MRSPVVKSKAYLLLVFSLLACGEDESGNTPPVALFESYDGIDRVVLDGQVTTDPDNDQLLFQWSSSDGSASIGDMYEPMAFYKIPTGAGGNDVDVTLTVSDGKSQSVTTQKIQVPVWSEVRSFGLGKSVSSETSNDVDYEWYIDQSHSGAHSLVNCGPASVTMAIKWFDKSFAKTAEDARDMYHPGGGWWYTNNIIDYLNEHSVTNRTIVLDQISRLKTEIDEGNIVILCLDMFFVDKFKDPEYHINKFYHTNGPGWGHFIVVKGYKVVDGVVLYETYDPYSFDNSYLSGGLKGKDRYYSAANLDAATAIWWDYAIVVERSGSTGGRIGVDVTRIPHKPGR
jgi:hypothetical protein